MAPYPTREEITAIFKHMETGNITATLEHVSPDVDWTVMGTHPTLSGRYKSLKEFQEDTVVRLQKIMKDPGIRFMVRNVVGGGEQEWATVELFAVAECKNGLKFDNSYAWCMRFDKNGQIVEVRAYLDVWMVWTALRQNEEEHSGEKF